MAANNERAELARETTTEAVIMRGAWITRQRKVAGFAVLETRTGSVVMLDDHATRIACLVLGIGIERQRAADRELLLRALVLGVARWEVFRAVSGGGELCLDEGLRYCAAADADGVPILSPNVRDELARAVAKASR